ncbi:MAG: hypothetical protein SPE62_07045, partial [Oscillospiraceae bacterium]|nr:hypothetical protein [Oscillospiraceae bacterium]
DQGQRKRQQQISSFFHRYASSLKGNGDLISRPVFEKFLRRSHQRQQTFAHVTRRYQHFS